MIRRAPRSTIFPDTWLFRSDYVLLDTYLDDPEALRHPEDSWRVYAEMAEKVLDLGNQTVR